MTMALSWSNGAVVDNTGLSLPSNPAFNSLLASLSPRLTNAYLVTHVAQYRPGESRHAHNLCLRPSGPIRSKVGHHQRVVRHKEAGCMAPR